MPNEAVLQDVGLDALCIQVSEEAGDPQVSNPWLIPQD